MAKLQAAVDLCATEEGAAELQSSLALLTEQLQALTSQEEQNVQELNSKLAAQIMSTEELRFMPLPRCECALRLRRCVVSSQLLACTFVRVFLRTREQQVLHVAVLPSFWGLDQSPLHRLHP